MTKDVRDLVLHVADMIKKIYSGYVPRTAFHLAKCLGCWYRKWCGVVPAKQRRYEPSPAEGYWPRPLRRRRGPRTSVIFRSVLGDNG
jgi:hypothetical protein